MDRPNNLGQPIGDLMRPLAVGIGLAGVISAASLLIAHSTGSEVSQSPAQQSEAPAEPMPPRPSASTPPMPIRPASPELLAVPVISPQDLERIEPTFDIAQADESRPGDKATLLYRPLSERAGEFEANGHRIRLEGIVPTAADEKCSEAGKSWPCGIHARTAFRNWLRGRAISCIVPATPAQSTTVTTCHLGKQDAAEWLVTQGWVRAETAGPYSELAEEAKKKKRGLFGPAPLVSSVLPPVELPDEPPQSGN